MGRKKQAGKVAEAGTTGTTQNTKSSPRGGARGTGWVSLLLALVTVFGVVWLYYAQNDFLEGFEARSYDLRFKSLRGPLPVQSDITVIAIDDKSIEALGRFPWTRQQYVRLLDQLESAKPRVLLFDVFFPEPENAQVDAALARAIERAGNVVLASTFAFDAEGQVTGRTGSLPALEAAAAGRGHINLRPEDDGVNRRNLLQIAYQDAATGQTRLMPALGLSAALFMLGADAFGAEPFRVWIGRGQELLRDVPVNGEGALWINYLGSAGAYPRVSFVDVLEGRVDPALLRDKVVFLGATALGVYDMRVTPFHPNTPGVEVHAAVADNILSQRYIQRTGMEALFDLLMILVIGFLSFYVTARMRLQRAIPVVVGLVVLYLGLAYWMFVQGHWVSMVYPPLMALLALLIGGGWRFMVLERSARQMRAIFSSYVSGKLVSQLERNPGAARIGGDSREVTVMFTDIKGFTTFSERNSAEVVVERLNEYLSAMVQIIHAHDGTVDKFMGDGIMAYWGAPLPQPDHARLALRCALAMKEKMVELTAIWRARGVDPFQIRGGVLSGRVVAGNIGSTGQKMEYTVIGDTVNQASRLEGAGKTYGIDFTVGESTMRLVEGDGEFHFRRLDCVRVVGKSEPVELFELRPAPAQAGEDPLVLRFERALDLYRARCWDEAVNSFRSLAADFPNDLASKLYLQRCIEFQAQPPGADWDGVFNRQEK
jgi:adenylate cyclase